ncbi:hypothetical protein ABPG72_004003 [Tetrahymena utriculariae]
MQQMKVIQLTLFLLLSLVAQINGSGPSWATAQQTQNYQACVQILIGPTCASGQSPTCGDAINKFTSCINCQASTSYSTFKSCVQDCGNTLTQDPTAKNDSTVTAFVNGYNQCVAAAYSAIFGLSTVLLLILALIL